MRMQTDEAKRLFDDKLYTTIQPQIPFLSPPSASHTSRRTDAKAAIGLLEYGDLVALPN
jgi:hypothetical protein